MTLLEIEMGAANSNMPITEFKSCLWHWCLYSKNKAKVNKLARQLNVYPKPANVWHAILEYLFEGTAITPYSYTND